MVRAPRSPRAWLTRLHRAVGLATAGFLFLSGITGSLIAFWPELDAALNPELFTSQSVGTTLPPSTLAAKVETADPRAQVIWMSLNPAPGSVVGMFVSARTDPATGKPYDLGYNQLSLDPVTGDVLGKREWGACCFERKHLMPFLHTLHYTLYLPNPWGVLLMGGIAIVWFVDCFIAIALTFPRRRPFLSRWGGAFLIRRGSDWGRALLDLHRAGGLWLWLVLGALAMSGVALNLNDQVFKPVVSFLLPVTEEPALPKPAPDAQFIGFDKAVALGARDAEWHGWRAPGAVYFDVPTGLYSVSFQRNLLDRGEGLGIDHFVYDGVTGALFEKHIHGTGRVGDTVMEAQFPLHSGRIIGMPGRVIICIAGLAVAVLSFTGVMMWSRRRKAQARLRTVPAPA